MRFKGCNCVHCNNIFTETDDAVVCPVCGSPHHRECWTERGECANTALHEEGFSWVFPEELRPGPEEKKPDAPEAIGTNYTFKNGESAIVCPHCNALNYGNDAFCMKCRQPLFGRPAHDGSRNMHQPENLHPMTGQPIPDENSYEYFQQFGGVRPDIMIDSIPVIEYSDFIGEKKSGRYIRKFLSMERFGKKISVSFAALFLGPIWYFYRKMIKEGLLYLLALLVLIGVQSWCSITESTKAVYSEMGNMYAAVMNGEISLDEMNERLLEMEEALYSAEPTREDTMKQNILTVVDLVYMGLSFAMAFFADYLYKLKCRKEILKIREECSDMITYRRTLHERGGTFTGGAVLGCVLVLALNLMKLLPAYYYMFSSIL